MTVIVRAATRADVEAICSSYRPIVNDTAISFEESAPDAAEIGRRMLTHPRLPWLVADDAGRVVGYAYASRHQRRAAYRWSAESSVYLDPEHRSRGIGRLLYECLIAEVRELGYVSLFAGVTLPNKASVALHEAVGFEALGVFRCGGYKYGAWHDVGWWRSSLRDPPVPPPEPHQWRPSEYRVNGTFEYRGLDRATLDREYSPSSCIRDLRPYLECYAERSAEARRRHRVRTDLRYGDRPEETLDFFPASQPAAPLHVFVHGGYWQELSKNESSFTAPAFLAAGAAFAAIGYGLAPAHRLEEITDMVRAALRWLIANAAVLGVDPRRIHVSGTSAGAHLVAMALLPKDIRGAVAGVTLLSGVYDLEPLVHTYVNDNLGLTRETARRNSPLHHLPARLPPVVLVRGGIETDGFIRQHEWMAAALRGRTTLVEVVSPARNHFDLPSELADPGTTLGRAVLTQMGLARTDGGMR